MKFNCCIFRLIMDGALAVLFLFLGIYSLCLKFWVLAGIFLLLGVAYVFIALPYARTVSITEEGVGSYLFGKQKHFLKWSEVVEVAVVGTKVSARAASHPGMMFLCFLDEPLNQDELFSVALKWPPKNYTYLLYDEKSYAAVTKYYQGAMVGCNIGKTEIGNFDTRNNNSDVKN